MHRRAVLRTDSQTNPTNSGILSACPVHPTQDRIRLRKRLWVGLSIQVRLDELAFFPTIATCKSKLPLSFRFYLLNSHLHLDSLVGLVVYNLKVVVGE